MRLLLANLKNNNSDHIVDDIDFSKENFDKIYTLNSINSCHVEADVITYDDNLIIDFVIKTNVTLISSYSAKLFDKDLTISDTIDFAFSENEDGIEVIKGNYLDLDQYIFDYIITSIPTVVYQKGEKLPKSVSGIKCEFEKDLKKEKDHRWDKLDDLDL